MTNAATQPLDAATETDIMTRTHAHGGTAALAKLKGKLALAENQLAHTAGIEHWRFSGGMPGFIKEVRDRVHDRTEAAARVAYLEKLAADPKTAGEFEAPTRDDANECAILLRLLIAARFPTSLAETIARANETHQAWQGKLAALQDDAGTVHHKGPEAQLKAGQIDAIEFARTCRDRVRMHEHLGGWCNALAASLAAFATALPIRVAALVKATGADALRFALVESAIFSGNAGDMGNDLATAATNTIGQIDAKLAALGLDPAKRPASVGLLAGDLYARRDEVKANAAKATADARKALQDRCGVILANAQAGNVAAWEAVGKSIVATPSAFPAKFREAWATTAVDAFADAGPTAIVEALSAQV